MFKVMTKIFTIYHIFLFLILILSSRSLAQEKTVIPSTEDGFYFPGLEKGLWEWPGPKTILDTIFMVYQDSIEIIKYGKTLNYNELKQFYFNLYKTICNQGFPFCSIKSIRYHNILQSDRKIKVNAYVQFDRGPRVTIEDVFFPGIRHTSGDFLKKIIHFKSGEVYNAQMISHYLKELDKLDYIEPVDSPEIVRKDTVYFLYLPVKEKNLIDFDFILGYAPEKNQSGSGNWSGRIFFHFKNLFGSGRRLRIAWEKPDRLSENLDVTYQERFLFGSRLNARLNLIYQVRDSLYASNSKGIGVDYPLGKFSMSADYSETNTTLDSSRGTHRGSYRLKNKAFHLGLMLDLLDNQVNPTRGFLIDATAKFGTISWKGDSSDQNFWAFSATLEIIRKISMFFPYSKLVYKKIGSNGGIPVSDLFYIGGANSLRGYNEDQFRTNEYVILSLEMRFLLNKYTRFHVFRDMGWLKQGESFQPKHSYGIGFLIPMKLGIIQIDYGLEKGFLLRNVSLHVRMLSVF